MTEFPILHNLGFILCTAAVAVLLLRLLKVPSIIAYMVAGLVLGPATGILEVTESMELVSETGIVLLLFLVGLELSLDHIRGVGKAALVVGGVQIVLTALAGWLLAAAFGFTGTAAVVIALAVTFSSTVVVVKLLGEKGTLHHLYGRIALGVLLVQDAAVVLALTLLAGLGEGEGAGVGTMTVSVLRAFAGMAVLAAAAAFAARYVLPRAFDWIARSNEGTFIWSLAWCFLFIVAAEAVHLSVELGAFIAGVGLAQLDVSETLRRRVQPVVNFFLAVFFVSLGLQMQPAAALAQWPLVLGMIAVLLVVKPAIVLATVPRLGYGGRTSFMASVSLAQMSEFSCILGTLALAAGLLDSSTLSAITLAAFISIGISSFVILGADELFLKVRGGALLRVFGATAPEPPVVEEGMRGHVIVVGMNTMGRRLALELTGRGESVLAIDTDPLKLAGLEPAATMLGTVDDVAVLDHAAFEHARLVISALQIEDTNALLTYRCHRAGVPISVHAFDTPLIDELRAIGADHVIVSKHHGTREIAQRLRRAGVLD